MSFALAMLVALVVEAAFGWPDRVYARIGHPVTWLGRLIDICDRRWNAGPRGRRLALGALCVALVVGLSALVGWAVQALLPENWLGTLLLGLCAAPLVAGRSMYVHVRDVAQPLLAGDLPAARQAVSMIVGRDPAQLDGPGVTRAALESLAENTSDGVVAPVFWGLVAGLPGIAAYKAINTLDSMIGHRTERHDAFGKVAARLDDLVNLIPARLTGLLFALSVPSRCWAALRGMWQEARHHRSPNAGWPEAALAAGLDVRLSGPRIYGRTRVDEPWIHEAGQEAVLTDLARGLVLYLRAMALMALALSGAALF